jgi:[protein-PII] uridylyltransferase
MPGADGAGPVVDPALEVRRQVSDDARTLGYALDDGWRAAERWRAGRSLLGGRGRPTRRPLASGVVEQNGEVVLARAALAPERLDQALPVRVVGAAARSGLPVAAATLEWLAATFPRLPEPWPRPVRDAFAELLGAGPGVVDAWEAADRYGLVTRWLPEWELVRNLPHRSPVHRFTVDRHLVETVALAAAEARAVGRPDLLLLGALLHDLGKGVPTAEGGAPGEGHAEAGVGVARAVTRRMGLPAADADTVVTLVRHHLLLPDTATRRDLSDPRTVRAVADAVGDTGTLDLLAALSRADARAAGPAAASGWRLRLVAELVDRVRALLSTGTVPRSAPPEPAAVSLAGGPIPAIRTDPDRVTVVAPADAGLLAAVAGCLAMHRLTVQSADVYPVQLNGDDADKDDADKDDADKDDADKDDADTDNTDKRDVERRLSVVPAGPSLVAVTCLVRPEFGTGPDQELLAADLRRAVRGDLPVAERLAARARGYRGSAPAAAPRVLWHDDAATGAVVLELRADDSIGLLYRVAAALAAAGAWVRAARVATLAGAAVDAFYLVGDWSDASARSGVEAAVLAAADPA